MSGLIRNLITFILALLTRERADPLSVIDCNFFITPFDCGVRILKSDKYLQLAESAQIDFLVKTKLIEKLRNEGINFVNVAQLVKFMKPVRVFKQVNVKTRVSFVDDGCAYFTHSVFVGEIKNSEILIKMKFKKGSLTIKPSEVLGSVGYGKTPCLEMLDQTLGEMT